jgi:hypothetical protein
VLALLYQSHIRGRYGFVVCVLNPTTHMSGKSGAMLTLRVSHCIGPGGDPGEVGLPGSDGHQSGVAPSAQPFEEGEDDEEPFFDPWAPLDPNEPGPWAAKPFRKMAKPRLRKSSQRAKPSHPFNVPPANPSGLTFKDFNYALPTAQQAKRAPALAAQRDVAGGQGALRSAFTREEAGAGVLVEDDAVDDRGGIRT